MISLTRIDNRLIHGQVLESWIPYLNANCIVVANDGMAEATLQRMVMESAVPRGIRVVIAGLEAVARLFAGHELDRNRVLLLFASSSDALRGHQLGIPFGELNLGNMHAGEGKYRLCCTLALDSEDIENLKGLEEDGVRIVSQCVPLDREQPWRKLIQNLGS